MSQSQMVPFTIFQPLSTFFAHIRILLLLPLLLLQALHTNHLKSGPTTTTNNPKSYLDSRLTRFVFSGTKRYNLLLTDGDRIDIIW